jgi:transcriptional regulator with XRE-family HTH domain
MSAATAKMGGSMGRKRKEPDEDTYSGRLAARVRKLREQSGKTAQEMADALGVKLNTYYAYESGAISWPNELTPAFAKVLGFAPRTVYPID